MREYAAVWLAGFYRSLGTLESSLDGNFDSDVLLIYSTFVSRMAGLYQLAATAIPFSRHCNIDWTILK